MIYAAGRRSNGSLIVAAIVLLLIFGRVTADSDMNPVLSESVIGSVQWMGGFIVVSEEASTQ